MKNRNSIKKLILEFLNIHCTQYLDEITESLSLKRDLGYSSLDIVELGIIFEKTFDINFEFSNLEDIQTVKDLIDIVENNCADINKNKIQSALKKELEEGVITIFKLKAIKEALNKLDLNQKNLESVVKTTLLKKKIIHITTIPEFDKVGKLSGFFVIVLLLDSLFIYKIFNHKILFNRIQHSDYHLKFEYNFQSKRELKVTFKTNKIIEDDYIFSFKNKEGILGAESFLTKYLRCKEYEFRKT